MGFSPIGFSQIGFRIISLGRLGIEMWSFLRKNRVFFFKLDCLLFIFKMGLSPNGFSQIGSRIISLGRCFDWAVKNLFELKFSIWMSFSQIRFQHEILQNWNFENLILILQFWPSFLNEFYLRLFAHNREFSQCIRNVYVTICKNLFNKIISVFVLVC